MRRILRQAFSAALLVCLPVILSAVPVSAGSEPRELDDKQRISAWKLLEGCPWSQSQISGDLTYYFEIELLLSPYGRISISRQGKHGEWRISTWVVLGDPYALIEELMSKDPPPDNPCDHIPVSEQHIHDPPPALVSHIEGILAVPNPFEIEEVLRLHQPETELRVRTPFIEYQASWLGCEGSSIGRWSQKLAGLLETKLDPCLYPRHRE